MGDDAQPQLITLVVDALRTLGVPYMIGGGIALNAWAAPRMTHDFDVVVDLPEDQIDSFCGRFPTDRYLIDPHDMRSAFHQRQQPSLGMYSFLDTETGFKVDLFPLRADDAAQQMALSRRVEVEVVEGLRAYVYAPADLLIQKLRWYAATDSDRQLRDCINLLMTDSQRPARLISLEYVQSWVSRLGGAVEQAWQKISAALDEAEPNHRTD